MKLFFLFSILFFQTTFSFADSYEFSASATNIGDIILAKDCLDYTFCGGESSSVALMEPDYRLHAFIELTALQLYNALDTCNFKKLGINVLVKNHTNNTIVVNNMYDTGKDIRRNYPNIFMKELSDSEKLSKYNKVKALIDQKQKLLAINTVLTEYGFSTFGYAIKLGGDMGDAGAVTDHGKKTIDVSDSTFKDPCELIQTIRHESEHALQMVKVMTCEVKGKKHNLSDHVARERSAYLNDIRSIPLFCPDKSTSDELVSFMTKTFKESYLVK